VARIKHIEVHRIRIPLDQPFRIAVGVIRQVETVAVRIVDDEQVEGWGEAAPHPHILCSTPDTTCAALTAIAPQLLGKDPQRLVDVLAASEIAIFGNSAAKAAVDIALHDLLCRRVGLPLWQFLGGADPRPIETLYSLGIGAPEDVAEAARLRVGEGFRRIKVKVGAGADQDVKTVTAVRNVVGPLIELTVDANQGWSWQEAVSALTAMEPLDVAYAEQPVGAEDLRGMSWVRSRTAIPIMADESVHSPEDAMRVALAGAADYINIKLMKSGGLHRAAKIASIAEAAAVPCMVGAMSETNLAITAAVHLAMAHPNIRFADLEVGTRESFRLFDRGGVRLEDGCIRLADEEAPGLGLSAPVRERLGQPTMVYTSRKGDGQ